MSDAEAADEAKRLAELALSRAAALGFQCEFHGVYVTRFRHESVARGGNLRGGGHNVPTPTLPALAEQLSGDVSRLSEHFGYINSYTGLLEILIRNPNMPTMAPLSLLLRRIQDADPPDCRHANGGEIPIAPWQADEEDERPPGRVHVTDSATLTCIEISAASPAGLLFGPPGVGPSRNADYPQGVRSALSLKVEFAQGGDAQVLSEKGLALTRAFLFEIAVRCGVSIEPLTRAFQLRSRMPSYGSSMVVPRFPTTAIKPEVAELFSFAESVVDNYRLAFLSYYQVLEYFLPYAKRGMAIRAARREIIDPRFDSASDAAILKILATAEGVTGAPEAEQVRILIGDSVRADTLRDFFAESDFEAHFTKSGPIGGVSYVNVKDSSRPLHHQVADRVYQIRNRIVHAKDDPKYAEVRVLLPKSREAHALGPDVALLRVLATEVIIDAQLV